jgi:hypothetical protein
MTTQLLLSDPLNAFRGARTVAAPAPISTRCDITQKMADLPELG